MKHIKFIFGNGPQFMQDMVFGSLLAEAEKDNIYLHVDYSQTEHLKRFDKDTKPEELRNIHGKGFTIYRRWNPLNTVLVDDETELFDRVVIGNVWQFNPHEICTSSDLVFIDGIDEPAIRKELVGRGRYYKRELQGDYIGVNPLNYCIPDDLYLGINPAEKNQLMALSPRTTFMNESDYYDDYLYSWFGHTRIKSGSDCLRHYEILANGCIPLFEDIENVHKNTMRWFPKYEVLELRERWKNYTHNAVKFYFDNKPLIDSMFSVAKRCNYTRLAGYIL